MYHKTGLNQSILCSCIPQFTSFCVVLICILQRNKESGCKEEKNKRLFHSHFPQISLPPQFIKLSCYSEADTPCQPLGQSQIKASIDV